MATKSSLTEIQTCVLQEIKDCIRLYGHPPTRKEIADKLGWKSPNAAEEHLRALERKGYITIIPRISRGIRLTTNSSTNMGLPMVGNVAAGSPIFSTEHIHDYHSIPANFFSPPAEYLLQVKGMSMRDAGILEDDWLAVRRLNNNSPRNGQIIVARVNDEVTVKRYKQQGRHEVLLIPANPDYDTMVVDLRYNFVDIEGLVVGVIRRQP